MKSALLLPLALCLCVFAAFFPALQAGWNYDDGLLILQNTHPRSLDGESLRWMFTTFHLGHYQPLAWVSLALDYAVWELDPRGYHLTNLAFHLLNTLLVFSLARELLRRAGGARAAAWAPAAAALLFALHPLRVESVVWVTQRRDVMSSAFLLGSVLLYLRAQPGGAGGRAARGPGWRALFPSCALYALSLLTKAVGVTVPVVLLLLDAWPLRRLGGERGWAPGPRTLAVWREKIPFFALALAAALAAPLAQRDAGAAVTLAEHGLAARCAQAAYGLVFYLWKTLWPASLVPIYEIEPPVGFGVARYGLAALALLALAALAAWRARRAPAIAVAALAYVLLLSPVLGFFQSGPQLVAERYSYLPSVGLAILAAAAVFRGDRRPSPRVAVPAAAVLLLLSALTFRQSGVWRTPESLWTHAVERRPGATAYINLAGVVALEGRNEEAVEYLRAALRHNPVHTEALVNLGNLLARAGEFDEATRRYREALAVRPDLVEPRFQLANALMVQGKGAEAEAEFAETLRRHPEHPEVCYNYGNLLIQQGRAEEGVEMLRRAARLRPNDSRVHWNLAVALGSLGRNPEAAEEVREVLRIEPQHPQARRLLDRLTR